MKKTNILLLGILLVAVNLRAQTLDEVIEKHLNAIGGVKNWDEVKSMKITGNYTGFSVLSDFTAYKTKEGKYYSNFGLGNRRVTEATNGSTAWNIDPWFDISFPRLMNKHEKNVLDQNAELATPFLHYKERGIKAELVEKTELEGKAMFKIKLTRQSGFTETWYIDAETFLPFKQESIWTDFGFPTRQETFFDDFQKVGKLVIPFYTERSFSIRNRISEIKKVELNVAIDDKMFDKPLLPEMQKLQTLAGKWNVAISAPGRRGWSTVDSVSTELNFTGTSNLLEGRLEYDNYFHFIRRYSITPNVSENNYRLTMFDDFSSSVDVYDGTLANDTLCFNHKPVSKESDLAKADKQRICLFNLKENGFTLEVSSLSEDGQTWQPSERYFFTRKE